MRTPGYLLRAGVTAAATLLGAACDQPAAAAAEPPLARVTPPPTPPEAPLLIATSANDSVRPAVAAGWPIVVEVRILLKPGADSLILTNATGPWSDALRLECTDANHVDRSSLFVAAYASEKSIEITRDRSGLLVWILDAVDLRTLPPGTCQIRAVLDEKKLGGVVPAGLASLPITVTVTSEPSQPPAEAARKRCLATMHAARWKQDAARAYATAASHLALYPKDVAVLILQGQIQRAHGQKIEALASFEAALSAAAETVDPGEENFAIETAVRQLRRELSAQ